MTTEIGRPLLETPDPAGAFPRLTDEQIKTLARLGSVRPTQVGDRLYEQGEQPGDFYVVLAGMVAVVEGLGPRQRIVQVHGPRRFLGEIGLLEGQPAFVGAIVVQPGEVLAVPLDSLRPAVLGDPVLGEEILRAYLIRRSLLIGHGAGLRIIGSCFSPDTRRLLEFAARNRLPHRYLDVEKDAQAETLLTRFGVTPDETPVVVLNGTDLLRNPSNAELARRMGVRRPEPRRPDVSDLLVIGAGPAGLATVVYGASDGLTVAAVEATATGGQAGATSRIENYLGFPAGISGTELAERSTIQADKFGGRITVPAEALHLRPRGGNHVVGLDDGTEIAARAVVIATGVRYQRLPVPGIERHEGTCVYYAATVHEARACRTASVSVVGGGNSAGQAAVFLARDSDRVYLLVRGGDLGDMSRYLVEQVTRHPRIAVLTHTEVRGVVGDEDLRGLVVEDTSTGERHVVDTQVLFVFIGARPHTEWLAGTVALDRDGFVLTGPDADGHRDDDVWGHVSRRPLALETSRPGVFAIGDVRRGSVKRVASAVGEGATAVRMVHDHLFEED